MDGIDHINVYSKSKTELGRWLSNFTHSPFTCEDGKFSSIEGYIYWLGSHDDRLRLMYGYRAKQLGREVADITYTIKEEDFKRKIRVAIRQKILNNKSMSQALADSTLPLDHYYLYGDKKVYAVKWNWVIEEIDAVRKDLKLKSG